MKLNLSHAGKKNKRGILQGDPFFCLPKHTCIENNSSNTFPAKVRGTIFFLIKRRFFMRRVVKRVNIKYVILQNTKLSYKTFLFIMFVCLFLLFIHCVNELRVSSSMYICIKELYAYKYSGYSKHQQEIKKQISHKKKRSQLYTWYKGIINLTARFFCWHLVLGFFCFHIDYTPTFVIYSQI